MDTVAPGTPTLPSKSSWMHLLRGRQFRPPFVTVSLMSAVAVVAIRYGVFSHELTMTNAVRYGLSGRQIQNGNWHVIITSQFLTRDGFMAVSIVLSLLVMLGAYEAIAGHIRALVVAVASAFAGPLLTTTAASIGSTLGNQWAGAALSTVDYGASAITAGAGGALVAILGNRKLRLAAVLWVLGGLLLHHQLADWEHLFSFSVGFGLGMLLGRPNATASPASRPARAIRTGVCALGLAVSVIAGAVLGPVVLPRSGSNVRFGDQAAALGVPEGTAISGASIVHLRFPAPSIGSSRDAYVLVPPGYDSSTKRYPVVEMLHGSPGAPLDMFNPLPTAQIADSGQLQPFIAVAPDGNRSGGAETDFADTNSSKMGTADSTDLRTSIESTFRTNGEWSVMGISSGGFGAANLALSKPGAYRAVCALSGFFTASGPAFAGESSAVKDATSPALHAFRNGPPVLVIAGAKDPRGLSEATTYAAALATAGQANRLQIVAGAGHDWSLWSSQLETCLRWVLDPPATSGP